MFKYVPIGKIHRGKLTWIGWNLLGLSLVGLSIFAVSVGCRSLPHSTLNLSSNLFPSNPSDLTSGSTAGLATQRVPIATVLKKNTSSEKPSPAVVLQGKVTQVAPLLTGTAYQLTDNTGAIWVFSPQSAASPSPLGLVLWVTGIPQYQSIVMGQKDWGETYIREQTRTLNQSSEQLKK